MTGTLSLEQQHRLAHFYPGRWHQGYTASKLRTDPLYPAVAKHLLACDDGETPLLDLGCGMGIFAFFLREVGFRAPILAFDYDAKKIARANQIAADHYEGITFHHGDAREALPDFQGHLSILDVLQYLTQEEQSALLEGMAKAVSPNGRLIIRSGLKDDSWRFRFTRWGDWSARLTFWMKGHPVAYPTASGLCEIMQAHGLDGEFSPLWGGTPFNNYLGVFARLGREPS